MDVKNELFIERTKHILDTETKTNFKKGKGADPNKPLCKKAKLLRLEKKMQKLVHNNAQKVSSQNVGKSLEQILNDIPIDSKHKIKVFLNDTCIHKKFMFVFFLVQVNSVQ